jgi:hypothetical protein
MDKATPDPVEIPSALPGFEDDDAREKLLHKASDEIETAEEDETAQIDEPAAPQTKRRWKVLKTVAGFGGFLCLLVVGVAWFFGMGWFSSPKPEAVNRSGQKNAQAAPPATEDEKLKMALSMIAPASSTSAARTQLDTPIVLDENAQTGPLDPKADAGDVLPGLRAGSQDSGVRPAEVASYPVTTPPQSSTDKPGLSHLQQTSAADSRTPDNVSNESDPDGARGRSLFFGVFRKTDPQAEIRKPIEGAAATDTVSPKAVLQNHIPFGTLLPVRLVGSLYTLRNSGGFVRMELTRAVEGKGYAYPAGTMIVGNVRAGESVRAFVDIVGLIDPVSGELVRFNGELLGRDGASGIEGKRRNLTSQWASFFRGMKETAGSVLGSIGAIRSGGTVILSEPLRRGTESMTEDLSGAILRNGRDDTFLEVAAGSNGYVLVTGLPESSTLAGRKPIQEVEKE